MSSTKQADKLRRAMQKAFEGETGKEVLVHLAQMCGATRSNFRSDPLDMARMEGRREVWLEIQTNLNLTESDLVSMARSLEEYDDE